MGKTYGNPTGLGLDYYSLLQVDPRASLAVIEGAYRALCKVHAPRKIGDDEFMLRQLNEARDVLRDPEQRKRYDLLKESKADGVIGHYELTKLLAEGGHCDVYLAKHMVTSMPVVIKHCRGLGLDNQMILVDEAKTLSDIRHFAIPKFRDIFRLDDGSIVLVEDYIAGPTLEALVLACGPLEAETTCWIAARLLQILRYLHLHGIVHGDIKPENLVLWPDEHQVFLVDFGLAAVKPQLKDKNKGWVEVYSPPEQSLADRPRLVPKNDFYALGMTMIFMLTADLGVTKNKRVPARTPEQVRDFIAKLTREDPKQRPDWSTEDLEADMLSVRRAAFNRERSGFGTIPDWKAKLKVAS